MLAALASMLSTALLEATQGVPASKTSLTYTVDVLQIRELICCKSWCPEGVRAAASACDATAHETVVWHSMAYTIVS